MDQVPFSTESAATKYYWRFLSVSKNCVVDGLLCNKTMSAKHPVQVNIEINTIGTKHTSIIELVDDSAQA